MDTQEFVTLIGKFLRQATVETVLAHEMKERGIKRMVVDGLDDKPVLIEWTYDEQSAAASLRVHDVADYQWHRRSQT